MTPRPRASAVVRSASIAVRASGAVRSSVRWAAVRTETTALSASSAVPVCEGAIETALPLTTNCALRARCLCGAIAGSSTRARRSRSRSTSSRSPRGSKVTRRPRRSGEIVPTVSPSQLTATGAETTSFASSAAAAAASSSIAGRAGTNDTGTAPSPEATRASIPARSESRSASVPTRAGAVSRRQAGHPHGRVHGRARERLQQRDEALVGVRAHDEPRRDLDPVRHRREERLGAAAPRAAARVHGGVDGGLPVEEEELRGRDLHRAPRDLQRHGLREPAGDERADRGPSSASDVPARSVPSTWTPGIASPRVQRGAAHERACDEAEQQDQRRGSTERAAQTARWAQGARLENGHGR